MQGLSLNVHRGDKIAIVGRSGVGKSTLCHLLAGIYPPHQGEILLKGTHLQQLSPATIGKYVHFIDQEATLTKHTGNIQWHRNEEHKSPLDKLNQRLYAHTTGKKLSGGEKQRILLARSLSYEPELLIMDETLNALDPSNAKELLEYVLATVPTVILVTHQQSLAEHFEYIYRLKDGQLQAA